jgi:hypothetical protein
MHCATSSFVRLSALGLLLAIVVAGCDALSGAGGDGSLPVDDCQISTDLLASGGVGKDGIPALTNPARTAPGEATYLADTSRVIGLVVGGEPLAVPHNILWHHEIANLQHGGRALAVTYCPLTGSSLAFDRAAVGGAEFGVSGLLFQNNLVMYDRTDSESLWPQMNRTAGCGPDAGTALSEAPVIEMTWAGWKALYPDAEVLSSNTGFSRNYRPSGYPYGDYERLNNDRLLVGMPIDSRRPPKERVLGIPAGEGGLALPFGALDNSDRVRTIDVQVGGETLVVFWNRAYRAAMAYRPVVQGGAGDTPLSFTVRGDTAIVDTDTGSRWRVDGRAVSGPRAGQQLAPVDRAYVAFWFAWAAFQPETALWTDSDAA